MTDFRRWPQAWPWFLIIPLYLFIAWFLAGATVAFYYWLRKDNQKAKKWFCYSLLALTVAFLSWWFWYGVKSGRWFKFV